MKFDFYSSYGSAINSSIMFSGMSDGMRIILETSNFGNVNFVIQLILLFKVINCKSVYYLYKRGSPFISQW